MARHQTLNYSVFRIPSCCSVILPRICCSESFQFLMSLGRCYMIDRNVVCLAPWSQYFPFMHSILSDYNGFWRQSSILLTNQNDLTLRPISWPTTLSWLGSSPKAGPSIRSCFAIVWTSMSLLVALSNWMYSNLCSMLYQHWFVLV